MKNGVLIGDPVDKSISHLTHNAVFKKCGIDATFEKLQVSVRGFDKEMNRLRKENYLWKTVTMPHKERILSYLENLDKHAEAIEAVNLIHVVDGEWIGYNTDGEGALNALELHGDVKGKKLVLLGAGGTARSIAYEANRRGADVIVVNRTYEKAVGLARSFGVKAYPEIPKEYDILVNATPVGMAPHVDEIPLDREDICKGAVVMDVVYSPRKTALLKLAQKIGCKTVSGETMFAEVSHVQFKIVYGPIIERKAFHSIVKRALGERGG